MTARCCRRPGCRSASPPWRPPARWSWARWPGWCWRASVRSAAGAAAGADHCAAGHAGGHHRPFHAAAVRVAGAAVQVLFGWQFDRGIVTITLAHITFTMAYVTVVVQSRLASFDDSLEEAALDLGARPAKVFFRITLPLIMPAISVRLAAGLHAVLGRRRGVAVRGRPWLQHAADADLLQGAPGRESQRQCTGHHHGADRGHWVWCCRRC